MAAEPFKQLLAKTDQLPGTKQDAGTELAKEIAGQLLEYCVLLRQAREPTIIEIELEGGSTVRPSARQCSGMLSRRWCGDERTSGPSVRGLA